MAAAAPVLVHVESIQTAVPARAAGSLPSGRSLPITVSGPPLTAAELQRRFRAVLYYRGAGGEQPDRAAWVKESLSAALVDHPEMAGRLRRRDDDDDGRRQWEVRLRDTGVRLVQATAKATMAAFLEEAKGDDDREGKEAALALWIHVDAQEPDICAPFFMQLTRFQDGGYAIGVSCSLLLADPLSVVGFLKSWARKHVANSVIQYTRYLQSAGANKRVVKSAPLDTTAADDNTTTTTTTVLFRAAADTDTPDHRVLAAACLDQASQGLGSKAPLRFTVMARDGSGGLNVETFTADGGGHAPRVAHWRDEAGLEDLVMEGSKPVHVSYSVSPCADEALVVVMPAGGDDLLISATVPSY